MSDTTRIISIVILLGMAFFCLQVGVFLLSGHKLKNNSRKTLILIEFTTGLLLLFDAFAYIFRGNTSQTGFYMVRISNFLVFLLNYITLFLFSFNCAEFIKSDILDFNILKHPHTSVKNGIPVHLFFVFYICLAGVILTIINHFTNIIYYFDKNNLYHRNSLYPLGIILGLSQGLISLTMILQSKRLLQKNVFISLLLYNIFPFAGVILSLFKYGISWINLGYGLGVRQKLDPTIIYKVSNG